MEKVELLYKQLLFNESSIQHVQWWTTILVSSNGRISIGLFAIANG